MILIKSEKTNILQFCHNVQNNEIFENFLCLKYCVLIDFSRSDICIDSKVIDLWFVETGTIFVLIDREWETIRAMRQLVASGGNPKGQNSHGVGFDKICPLSKEIEHLKTQKNKFIFSRKISDFLVKINPWQSDSSRYGYGEQEIVWIRKVRTFRTPCWKTKEENWVSSTWAY